MIWGNPLQKTRRWEIWKAPTREKHPQRLKNSGQRRPRRTPEQQERDKIRRGVLKEERARNSKEKEARDADAEETDVGDECAKVYKTTKSMRSTAKKGSFGDGDGD